MKLQAILFMLGLPLAQAVPVELNWPAAKVDGALISRRDVLNESNQEILDFLKLKGARLDDARFRRRDLYRFFNKSNQEIQDFLKLKGVRIDAAEFKRGAEKILRARLESMIAARLLKQHVEPWPKVRQDEWLKEFKSKPEGEQQTFLDGLKQRKKLWRSDKKLNEPDRG